MALDVRDQYQLPNQSYAIATQRRVLPDVAGTTLAGLVGDGNSQVQLPDRANMNPSEFTQGSLDRILLSAHAQLESTVDPQTYLRKRLVKLISIRNKIRDEAQVYRSMYLNSGYTAAEADALTAQVVAPQVAALMTWLETTQPSNLLQATLGKAFHASGNNSAQTRALLSGM